MFEVLATVCCHWRIQNWGEQMSCLKVLLLHVSEERAGETHVHIHMVVRLLQRARPRRCHVAADGVALVELALPVRLPVKVRKHIPFERDTNAF